MPLLSSLVRNVCLHRLLPTTCWQEWRGSVRQSLLSVLPCSHVGQRRFCSEDHHHHHHHRRRRRYGGELDGSRYTTATASTPIWQQIMECIQVSVQTTNDVEKWRCLCQLWRTHFSQSSAAYLLPVLLEEELLAGSDDADASPERVPRDLHSLPVFLQALCTAVQLGEALLKFPLAATGTGATEADMALLASVLVDIRVVVFYLTQERLTHVLHAAHYRSAEEEEEEEELVKAHVGGDVSTKEVVSSECLAFPSRDFERVSHMGVRLLPGELQRAVMLADTSAALLALDPPVSLLPILYRLLLPALGACEQLDAHYLGILATAVARSADFDEPGENDASTTSSTSTTAATATATASAKGDVESKVLRPVITSYTVMSHLHAIARALEVRMREATPGIREKSQSAPSCDASLRLLSLKERKVLERQRDAACKNAVDASVLMGSVAVVCSALAGRRYADDRFWHALTEFTQATIRGTVSDNILHDVRDILFALDYVHQTVHFHSIMSLLVDLRLVQEPIMAPSAVRGAMKAVKGQTAATFER